MARRDGGRAAHSTLDSVTGDVTASTGCYLNATNAITGKHTRILEEGGIFGISHRGPVQVRVGCSHQESSDIDHGLGGKASDNETAMN